MPASSHQSPDTMPAPARGRVVRSQSWTAFRTVVSNALRSSHGKERYALPDAGSTTPSRTV